MGWAFEGTSEVLIIIKMQVRTEHERAKHAALYVPVTDQPAYNLGKGSVTCKVHRTYSK